MRPLPLMIFAAGFGTRMGALTATRPKPLLPVAGRPLIDHALSLATEAGIQTVVVNLHYLGDQIADHLNGSAISLSWEEQILETGGGLKAALPLLGPGPVLTLNSDAVWTGLNPLSALLAAWDPECMDALLLLVPREYASGYQGQGDFTLREDGLIQREKGASVPVYAGAQIIKTDALAGISETAFSMNRLWDDMIANARAFGLLHHGGWCDVGHPQGIETAEALLTTQVPRV